MDSFDDWDILSPPSAPHSDDERDTVVVQHGAKDNNNNFGDVLEPRRASSPALNPGTPTGLSAGSFARADSNSDVDVADEFEDLDAGVISRFPPRHSYSDAQQRLRNDMAAEPAGVDQWLRLAEESLTAGASRAASDLVALLAVVKRGSSAKPNLPVEDVGTAASTGEENLADSSENAEDIFTREVSSSDDDDDWRSLVRSLGPARFFLPLGIVLVTVCVVLVYVASGGSVVSDARSDAVVVAAAAVGSRGSCAVPTSSFDAGSIDQLHGPHIGDCPAYADDHTRVHVQSNSRELPTREDSLLEDVSRLTGENDRLRAELAAVAAELTSELDRVTLELDAVVRHSDVLRRQTDTHLTESAVWKHSSENWYDAYQRAWEDCRAVAPWSLASGTKALARAAIGTVMRYGGEV